MSHHFLRKLFALLMVLMLVLVACERPLQQPAAPTESAPTAEVITGEQPAGETPTEGELPAEGEAPAEGETAGGETTGESPRPGEGEAAPAEGEAAPAEGEVAPAEGEAAPAEGEAAPAEGEAAPAEGEAAPAEGEAAPAEGEAAPAEGETAPAEGETAPAEGEAAPAEGEAVAAAAARPETHTVAQGENLYQIGLKYGLSWVVLAQYNNLPNANRLEAGQVLRIPPLEGAPTPTPAPPAAETTYTVQTGDNLFRIGLAYGVSWVQIAEANGIVNPNQIVVGQVLKIPVSAPGVTPEFVHKVAAGETIFLISLRYGVAWTAIAEKNNIAAPYVIYPGQELIIPGGN
ncbi:MAG: hypothetical protein Fur0021_04820 [Candidatus Promineifilaceae bacterium]